MKGVFAKTHLATLLLLYKQGRLPDLQRMVARQPGHAKFQELHEALSQGIFMHVFPFDAVRDHPDDFKCLMAYNNFDHAFAFNSPHDPGKASSQGDSDDEAAGGARGTGTQACSPQRR